MVFLKRFFVLATAIHITLAVKPPNYIEKPKVPDKFPPKYEYNYFVANRHTHAAQGHKEIRNGDFTRGNYFVNLPKGESKTTVNYIADEWGFFPVTRYSSRGPHHRWSGHFALGQHAVERLNETNLNINEVFMNQSPEYQQVPQQQQAQATFPAPQVVLNPNQVPVNDNKLPQSNVYASNQPQSDHQQQIVFPSPGAIYNHQAIPLYRNQEKHENPMIYQHAPQMPLIYQYAQQHAPPQINYYYQQQQQKPQEVIYHQQPIASMADLQQNTPQQQFVVNEIQHLPESGTSNDGSINELTQASVSQEIISEEILPPHRDGVIENLLQVPVALNNVATDNQKHAKYEKDSEEQSQEVQFNSPIVVNEQQKLLFENANEAVIVQQKQGPVVFTEKYQPVKQINLKILTGLKGSGVEEQYLREVTPKAVNGHTNSNNAHYLVEDVQGLEVTPPTRSEAPSRQFLKNFKTFRNYDQSTVAVSYSTTTSRSAAKHTDRGCCNDNGEKIVVSTTPISTNFLAPVHAGIRLTNEKLDDCVDGHTAKPILVEVKKNVNIKNYLAQEIPLKVPVYGDKIFVSTTPSIPISTQAIYFKEEVHVPVEKTVFVQSTPRIVDRPVYIKTPPETKILHQQVFVEKPVIKEVQVPVPVEKTVFIKSKPQIVDRPVYIKSPPEIQVVQQQILVEKPVIKEVQVPVEKTVYVKSKPEIVDRPVYLKSQPETRFIEKQVFIEKPVIKEVHVPFEKTVYIKSKPEIIDRPVYIQSPPETKIVKEQVFIEKPVIKEVQVPVEKTVYIKSKPEIIDRPVYIQSPPETKIVEKQVFIDRPVIKEVQVPVEKTVYINSPPQTIEKPVYIEKIVDRPVETIVEKIIDRPYPVEKYIDRPYPVPYAVHVPYEKHILTKPDFHVYAKSIPHKGKIFDFDGLFGFLGKKKEIKHIFVPSSQQHQLKQLNHHQLIQSSLTTIDAVKEAPVLDYTKYATSHLNPIKPVYGVPSTPLEPVHGGYNYQNPYAGNFGNNPFNYQNIASIPSHWANDNLEAYSQQSHVATPAVHRDNYVGPTPLSDDYWAINGVSTKEGIKFRRNVENGRSLRIEYGGFLPKMSPSVEIDQNGTPLKKEAIN